MHTAADPDPFYYCMFCDAERHVRGAVNRVTSLPFKSEVEYRNDYLAHVARVEVSNGTPK